MSKKLTTEEFIEKGVTVHDDKYSYSEVVYINSRTKVTIICPEHGDFKQTPHHHINRKQGCLNCNKLSLNDFINQANEIHNDIYNYDKIKNFKNTKSIIEIACPKHGRFTQRLGDHLYGKHGCPNCTMDIFRKSVYTFIDEGNKVHGDKYDYSKTKQFTSNKDKVIIECSEHGEFEQRPNDHLNGQGCPICKESKGEKEIRIFLDSNNIEYHPQHKFDNCRNKNKLPFDFYLPKYNMCIEYQGQQHYKPIKVFGGEKGFKRIQKSDKIKKEYCLNNNIPLLEIKYNENIEEILLSRIPIIT